ncbi:hypothetical protein [Halovivax limisalsi]|uniref:hypothetical protein n=1 Tax=Halovivax limisalsi TaxID=1453760 RepID=UPI001FFD8646|nr:hypothetical protein [Halovivax limisalsi]
MKDRVYRSTLFALYQSAIMLGIMLMPVALASKQLGITVPLHRLLGRVETAYENAV